MAIKVGATYIGGYPQGGGAEEGGVLVGSAEGLTFTWANVWNLNTSKGSLTIPTDEIIAVGLEDVDAVRALRSVATGYMWGGVLGGIMASHQSDSRVIAVRCRRDGAEFTTLFASTDIGSRTFVDGWQRERQIAGLPPLPPIDQAASPQAETQQLALLQDISAKLDRLIAALEKPV